MAATVVALAVAAALVSLLPGVLHRWVVNGLFGLGLALLVVRVAMAT
jgi:hypothetical protein